MIDLEFEETSVREKWREYMDCLLETPGIPEADASEDMRQVYSNELSNCRPPDLD